LSKINPYAEPHLDKLFGCNFLDLIQEKSFVLDGLEAKFDAKCSGGEAKSALPVK
jgi:hypothetical protein